jgi:hypothetical protein
MLEDAPRPFRLPARVTIFEPEGNVAAEVAAQLARGRAAGKWMALAGAAGLVLAGLVVAGIWARLIASRGGP